MIDSTSADLFISLDNRSDLTKIVELIAISNLRSNLRSRILTSSKPTMEDSDVNKAFSKTIRKNFEAPRQTRAQSLPVPLARGLTPRLTRKNLEKHNKLVGDFGCSCRGEDLEPWIPFKRSVTHVGYRGSVGGVLMERQPARRGDQGGHLGAAPRSTMSSQIRKAEPRIKFSAANLGARFRRLLGCSRS